MVEEFYRRAAEFLERLLSEADASGVDLAGWDIDHICYRVETIERYQTLKSEIATIAELLIESEVNGRPISTFKLQHPISIRHRSIHLLELPAPKPTKKVTEGFEHIEVVAPVALSELQIKYSGLPLDENGLEKRFNQELEVCLQSGAIKFHNLSLASVVQLEKNHKVLSTIKRSRVLDILWPYGPLIAGTIPLGIEVPTSDVDILVSTLNQVEVKTLLEREFGKCAGFEAHYKLKKGRPALIVSFEFENVPFEIFAQELPSVEQTAYKHFLIEERLLKLGGARFNQAIRILHANGMKTEPAFAAALKLDGDPYDALLLLADATESELILFLNKAGF